jgi:hypothetical protein
VTVFTDVDVVVVVDVAAVLDVVDAVAAGGSADSAGVGVVPASAAVASDVVVEDAVVP